MDRRAQLHDQERSLRRGRGLGIDTLKTPEPSPPVTTLEEVRALEREVIARALDASGGKIYGTDGAAAKLGIKATTLASRLKKLGLGKARSSE